MTDTLKIKNIYPHHRDGIDATVITFGTPYLAVSRMRDNMQDKLNKWVKRNNLVCDDLLNTVTRRDAALTWTERQFGPWFAQQNSGKLKRKPRHFIESPHKFDGDVVMLWVINPVHVLLFKTTFDGMPYPVIDPQA